MPAITKFHKAYHTTAMVWRRLKIVSANPRLHKPLLLCVLTNRIGIDLVSPQLLNRFLRIGQANCFVFLHQFMCLRGFPICDAVEQVMQQYKPML